MKQVGSIQVSVVAFVVLLACQNKGECSATRYSALNNTTIPTPTTEMISEKFTQTPQRQIRESYRQPEIPVFGKEDHESRISVHNFRNHMRDDDMSRHNRPVMKGIKKSSSTVSIKSSISIKSSSKKSSKRDGSTLTIRPSGSPTLLPSIVLPTISIEPTGQPSTTIPTTTAPSTPQTSSKIPSQNPTLTAITDAPTADRTFPIEAPTYSLFYFFDDSTGDIGTSDQDFIQLGEITKLFLDDYFDGRYGSTFIITFDRATTQVVGFSSISLPIQTFFFTTVFFSETSIFYPPTSEIETEIEKAFTTFGSNFEYLMAIRELPRTNPFQTVSSVNWGGYGTG